MKYLFTVQSAIGYLHAVVPLTDALKEKEHEVAFAISAGLVLSSKKKDIYTSPVA
jgi:hypothetical protein